METVIENIRRVSEHSNRDAALREDHHACYAVLDISVMREHELPIVPVERDPAHTIEGIAVGVGST